MKYHPYVWLPHVSAGTTHTFSHLNPFSFVHTAPARSRGAGRPIQPAVSITVNVAFSHHCFTVSAKDPTFNPQDLYAYKSDERSFCPQRTALSQHLPAAMARLAQQRSYRTKHGNYFFVALKTAHLPPQHYVVYYQTEKGGPGVVNVLVESAYLRPTASQLGHGNAHDGFTAILMRSQ